MACSEDSPLLRLPTDISRKQLLALDGVRYSVGAAHLAYDRLVDSLVAVVSVENDHQLLRRHVLAAITDAWAVIDAVHRARLLIPTLTGLKQKKAELEVFGRNTIVARDLRHYVQHLNEKIGKVASTTDTLWGSISWRTADGPDTDVQNTHMIIAGTVFPGASAPSSILGPRCTKAIAAATLTAGGYSANLGRLVQALERVTLAIEDGLRDAFAGKPCYDADWLIKAPVRMSNPMDEEVDV